MDRNFWNNKKIFITGGKGFLGSHIIYALKNFNCNVFAPIRAECDFLNLEQTIKKLKEINPDIVIHTAVDYGDLTEQLKIPAQIMLNNLKLNNNLLEASYNIGVKKFIGFGSYLAYPSDLNTFLREDKYLDGELSEVSRAYGSTKRMLYFLSWAYRKENNFNSINLILPNIYGKGQRNGNVVSALIKKIKDAKLNNKSNVVVWGDGSSVRDFLYIEDAVKATLLAVEKYDECKPLNLGTGVKCSIKDLVSIICKALNFKGEIVWDKNKPNGIPFRVMDVSKMKLRLNYSASISIEDGIKKLF